MIGEPPSHIEAAGELTSEQIDCHGYISQDGDVLLGYTTIQDLLQGESGPHEL